MDQTYYAGGTARMDPWMLVRQSDGSEVLFGFALEHPVTGGLAWTCSSPVVELDRDQGHAVTASGRRYRLGAVTNPLELPDEEARLAYALLVGPHLMCAGQDFVTVHVPKALAVAWVTTRKMARHLNVEAPPLSAKLVRKFYLSNEASYFARRNSRGPV